MSNSIRDKEFNVPSLFWWRREETEELEEDEALEEETEAPQPKKAPKERAQAQPEAPESVKSREKGKMEQGENRGGPKPQPTVTIHPDKQTAAKRSPAPPVVQTQKEAPREILAAPARQEERNAPSEAARTPVAAQADQEKKSVVNSEKVMDVKDVRNQQAQAAPQDQAVISDCEMYLRKWNEIARKRNAIYMQRMAQLEKLQVEIESDIDKIKCNPITLRAMSDLDNKAEMATVRKEAARRRADTFSSDSTSISEYLREFEGRLSSWVRMTHLALEVAMLAPLPELGRHSALLKNVRVFLDTVGKNRELQIYQSENSQNSIHERLVAVNTEMEALFKKAFEVLDHFCRAKEQPIDFNIFKKEEQSQGKGGKQKAAQQQKQAPQQETRQQAQPPIRNIADEIEYSVGAVSEDEIVIPGAIPTGGISDLAEPPAQG